MFRKLLSLAVVVFVAGGAAWWASERELLGARPVWSPSPAEYAPLPPSAPRTPGEPGNAASGPVSANPPAVDGPADAALDGAVPAPPARAPDPAAAPDPASGRGAPAPNAGAEAEALFPPADKPTGLDEHLRSAARDYRIEPGDTLGKIARRHAVPVPLLVNMNAVDPERILAGANLKVVRGPFHALVLRDRHVLRLYNGGVFVKEYGVATGKPGHETRLGDFRVQSKLQNPAWTNPETRETVPFGEPGNPLGTRWIGFAEGLGVHGTWEEDSIGKAASSGCVRMRNEDVEELFDLLVIGESSVRIVADVPAAPAKPAEPGDRGEGR